MDKQIYNAFTTKYKNIALQLVNQVTIINSENLHDGKALWDTGATGTCISQKVVNALQLIPTGKRTIMTPQGSAVVDTYLINIVLPNKVKIENVVVCGANIDSQGIDVLVGMDIICMGDFAVSNYNGNTTFSFRVPSKAKTDFVQEINIENLVGTHGKGKRKKK